MLRFALLELMPQHEGQRRLLPNLEIQISDNFTVKLKMQLRKGQRRSQLQHDPKPALEELRVQIEELMVMREKLVNEKLFFNGTEPTILPMIEALGDKIQRSASTRQMDLRVLRFMARMLWDGEHLVFRRSRNDESFLRTLSANIRHRRLFGWRNLDLLVRRFRVSIGDAYEVIHIDPWQMEVMKLRYKPQVLNSDAIAVPEISG
jgi:hypothetical protein